MDTTWTWLTLAFLGAFHGINPAMGWLFAVALGMQEKNRRAVVMSLIPMALGHAVSIGMIVLLVRVAQELLSESILRPVSGTVLLGFGFYKLIRSRHPARVGMRVTYKELTLWSFLMASVHGAGLMLTPVLLGWTHAQPSHLHLSPMAGEGSTVHSPEWLIAAVGIHTVSFLLAAGFIAVLVYAKFGLALLRKAWFTLDLLWVIGLIIAGVVCIWI